MDGWTNKQIDRRTIRQMERPTDGSDWHEYIGPEGGFKKVDAAIDNERYFAHFPHR